MLASSEASRHGPRVNGVCASAVDTELWHQLPETERLATFERFGAREGRLQRGRDHCNRRRSSTGPAI
jgi:hypothetical protein